MSLLPATPFDGGYLLGGKRGQVHFVNEVAYSILSDMADAGASEPSPSVIEKLQEKLGGSQRAAIESVRSVIDWREANLDAGPSPDMEGVSDLAPPADDLPFPKANLQLNGQSVRLTVEDPAVLDLLWPMILHVSTSETPEPGREVTLTGPSGHGRYALYLDGRLKRVGPTIFHGRHMALEGMALASVPTMECFALQHAAAVDFEGTGMVLCGPSGAGKTTLLLDLLAAGASFISDDLVPLLGASATTVPMPFAIGVKDGSHAAARPLFPRLDDITPVDLAGRMVRYVAPTPENVRAATAARPIDLILLPQYAAGKPPEVRELNPLEALTRAAELGSWFNVEAYCLQHLSKFYERTPAVTIRYRSSDEAIRLVHQQIEALKSRRAR